MMCKRLWALATLVLLGLAPAAQAAAPKSGSPKASYQFYGRAIKFSLTTRAGWHYQSDFLFGYQRVRAGIDVRSSPPGRAQLLLTTQSTYDIDPSVSYTDDNPGRPNGPKLDFPSGYWVYPLPAKLSDDITDTLPGPGFPITPSVGSGLCSFQPPYGLGGAWWPGHGRTFWCADSSMSEERSFQANKHVLRRFAQTIGSARPYYVINLAPVDSECNISISPSDIVTFAPGYPAYCPRVRLRVVHDENTRHPRWYVDQNGPVSPSSAAGPRVAP